ncbi:MAG: phage terminase large subunit [Epibacterium sp.]|nr:phage terminase large subunit [Epibacterium sp.]NQX73777.1 hypothetical protein [Epibacterium sp.]
MLEGGTRSGKTYSALEYLLNVAVGLPNMAIGVFRYNVSTCRESSFKDAKAIIASKSIKGTDGREVKLSEFFEITNSPTMQIKCKTNDSKLVFMATEDVSKLHGPQWDIAYFNEAMEVQYDAFKQVLQRTSKTVIIDFNPSKTRHWVFDSILPRGRSEVLYIHSTFKDNPHLSAAQVSDILAYEPNDKNRERGTADAWHWDVYGLGKRGKIEGAVYDNWSVRLGDWPKDQWQFKCFGYAVDWGYSVDPTVLLEVGLHNNHIYVRELCYEAGMLAITNPNNPKQKSLEQVLRENAVNANDPIIADSASPESIDQVSSCGFNMIGAKKGPNSILEGIQLLRQHHIFVHHASTNVQEELENYRFSQHKDGHFRQLPEDRHNHAMDALRYWALYNLKGAEAPKQRANARPRPRPTSSTRGGQRRW